MSDQTGFDDTLAAFGQAIGLQGLALDEQGHAALTFDDRLVVNLERDPSHSSVLLYAVLGEPAGELLEAYAMLLEANYLGRGTGGATLGLAPDSDRVALSQSLPLASLDLPGFTAALETFVTSAEHWTARIAHLGVPASNGAAAIGPGDDRSMVWG